MSMFVKLAAAAALAVGLSFGGAVAPVQATTLTFSNFTNNGDVDVAGQLTVEVINLGPNADGVEQVGFKFMNKVGVDSVATRMTFGDSGGLFVSDSTSPFIYEESDPVHGLVKFQIFQNTQSGHGAEYGFDATDRVVTDGSPPNHGLRHEEHFVTIAFSLAGLNTYKDVIAALTIGAENPLLIGLHVQSIGGEGGFSDKFSVVPIPLPAGLVLFLSGLLGIGILGRYKAKRREPASA